MDNLNDVLIFTKVVEQGGFTAAAKVLGLPKSSVSRGVSRLEERLQVRLLQRSTRRTRPTEIGQRYYEYCQRILLELQEANSVIESYRSEPSGLLRITAPYILGQAFLSNIVAEFLDRYSEVRCQVVLLNRYVDLIEEGFDVAIRVGSPPESSLSLVPVGQEDVKLFASPSYLEKKGIPRTPAELAGHVLLDTAHIPAQTWTLTKGSSQSTVDWSPRLVCNDVSIVLENALSHQGIAALPNFTALDAVSLNQLKPVLPDWHVKQVDIQIVYPSYKDLSPSLRAFVTISQEQLKRF